MEDFHVGNSYFIDEDFELAIEVSLQFNFMSSVIFENLYRAIQKQ
jgi:hypothetical protein